jgi:DNA-directed RNA polymerase subunit F
MRKIIDKKYISYADLKKIIEKIRKILVKARDTNKLKEVPKILEKLNKQDHIALEKVSSQTEIFIEIRHKNFPCSWSISITDRKKVCIRYCIISENESKQIELFEILRNDAYAISDDRYKRILEFLK